MNNEDYKMLEKLFDAKLALLAEKLENSVVSACVRMIQDGLIHHGLHCEGPKLAKSWKWLVRTLIVVLVTVGIAAIYKTFLG